MLISIAGVTISTSDFSASRNTLENTLEYVLLDEGEVSRELSEFWSSPNVAGSRYAVLGPASGEDVFIRLIEAPPVAGYAAFKTYGWNATEIHVDNVAAIASSLADSPLDIIGGPRDLLNNGSVVALQAKGPSDEIYYLTEISSEVMQRSYGKAESHVGRIFIVVLGCENHEASRKYYAELAEGVPRARKFSIRVLANAHGLDPVATRFPIGSAILREQFRIELDGYPSSAIERPSVRGYLPPGLSMVSFRTDPLTRNPYEPVATARGLQNSPYFGQMAQLLTGPDGEWLELIEAP